MAAWPSTLPAPLRAGYGAEVGGNVLRTDFDSGPARQRLRYGAAPEAFSVGFIFSAAQMVIFNDFWVDDINRGTDWFTMDLNIGDGWLNYEVRFVGGNFKKQMVAIDSWQISASLDVRSV